MRRCTSEVYCIYKTYRLQPFECFQTANDYDLETIYSNTLNNLSIFRINVS